MKPKTNTKKLINNGEFEGIKVEDITELKIKGLELVVKAKGNRKLGFLRNSEAAIQKLKRDLQNEIREYYARKS